MDRFVDHLDEVGAGIAATGSAHRFVPPAASASANAAHSENLSRRGVLFITEMSLPLGSNVDVMLRMPEEVSGVTSTEWLYTGRVVRVDRPESNLHASRVAV
jgi:hypothetical protein